MRHKADGGKVLQEVEEPECGRALWLCFKYRQVDEVLCPYLEECMWLSRKQLLLLARDST